MEEKINVAKIEQEVAEMEAEIKKTFVDLYEGGKGIPTDPNTFNGF